MGINLREVRDRIDDLDKTFVKTFEERMDTVLKVAEYKKQNNMPVLDKEREQQVVAKNLNLLNNKIYSKALENLLERLMLVSRNLQQEILFPVESEPGFFIKDINFTDCTVAFQGVPGSFSQQALQGYLKNVAKFTEQNYLNFEDVFIALDKGEVEYGVLPLENSTTGAISDIYDLLNKYELCIVGEYCLRIEQCLLVKPGTKLEQIQKVYSHPQGFSQSREFLQGRHWELVPYFNTAKSAEYVASIPENTVAAIAGRNAAKLYNLEIIRPDINFNGRNYTRFVILGKKKLVFPNSDKVSLIISLPHKAGSLARVLNYFEEHGINLLKLESRPNLQESWTYYFYLDFHGNLWDSEVQMALNKVKADSVYFRILGNYPEHKR